MGKYQAYPEYKKTENKWFDCVPSHWDILPLKYLTSKKVTDGPHETPKFVDEGIPFLSVDGIQNNTLVFEGCRYVTQDDHQRFSAKCMPKFGDVLLGKAASVGKVAFVGTDIKFNVWSPLAVISPRDSKTGKFIYYSLQSAILQMQCDMFSNANTQKNLGMTTIDNLKLSCPSDLEAETIANFLDYETAKIETLIEKQQQLIQLLKEKRQAVISHAVTKGLSSLNGGPNAPMKDSGLEWLGEVPDGWDVCLIKYKCVEITDGAHISPVTEDGERYFVSITDIKKGHINFHNALLTTQTSFEYMIKTGCMPFAGDILFSKDGTIGQTAITPEGIEFVVASSLIIIRPNKNLVNPKYLNFLLQSGVVASQVERMVKGAGLPRLSIQNLLKVSGAFPPKIEQSEICDYLEKSLTNYDDLELKALEMINLMQERRTALISAAVTGKIDVRHFVSKDGQAPQD